MDSLGILSPLLVILVTIGFVNGETTTFDEEALTVINDTTLTPAELTEYADPAGCDSKLYNKTSELGKNLAVNIRVDDWSAASSAEYFRAHPVVTACIQAVFTKVKKLTSTQATLLKGYEPKSVTSGYSAIEKKYLSSGCGAKMAYKSGSGDLAQIAKAALMVCPMKFEALQRDIGVHVLSDGVLIFMVGGSDTQPDLNGVTTADAKTYVNDGLELQKIPDCSPFAEIDNGNFFPDGISDPTSVVGAVDVPVTRALDTDFRRLVQYLGTSVDFEDDNGAGCDSWYVGNSVSRRCDDRLMSTRMYDVIYYLKSYVKDKLGGNIKITEAWDDGTENPGTLHTEGRAVKLTYPSGNTAANLKTISQLAICAKADYVAHKGDHLFIAVKKQFGRPEQTIEFTDATLVVVEPPSTKASSYALLDQMQGEEDNYPLFDSNGRLDLLLDENAPVSTFVAKDAAFRYYRLDPAIVKCYSRLVYQENKWDPNGNVEIVVERAFMSNEEQAALIQPSDLRYNQHTLGQAMQLRYATPSANYTVNRLLKKVVDVCSPAFHLAESNINLGLYSDSVFVAMDDEEFSFWVNDDSVIPAEYGNEQNYANYLEQRKDLAIQGRIVDPDYPEEACNEPYVPEKQNLDYKYKEPLVVQRKRRRRRSTVNTCVPTSATDFCAETEPHRQEIVDKIWHEMSVKKHVYHEPQSEVKEALEGCLLACGTCLEGDIFEAKKENCSNLIHWAPFDLMNTAKDMSNVYARDNMDTYSLACEGSGHCLVRAPLFSQLAPYVKQTYRPDPERSVVEDIYAAEENPSPLIQLLDELYAVHAKGIIKFWVADEKEITAMQASLEAAMMYNHDVTAVHVYVTNEISMTPVQKAVESYAFNMAKQGCPYYTREILAPYEILSPPHHVRKKRDAMRPHYENSEKLVRLQLTRELSEFSRTQGP